MKLKCKYTLLTMSASIVGCIIIIMLATRRIDIWNLPKEFILANIVFILLFGLYFGGLILYIENKALKKSVDKKEHKIGEIFEYGEKRLIVKEDESGDCWYCVFDDEIYGCMKPFDLKQHCNGKERKDKKNVVFVDKDKWHI